MDINSRVAITRTARHLGPGRRTHSGARGLVSVPVQTGRVSFPSAGRRTSLGFNTSSAWPASCSLVSRRNKAPRYGICDRPASPEIALTSELRANPATTAHSLSRSLATPWKLRLEITGMPFRVWPVRTFNSVSISRVIPCSPWTCGVTLTTIPRSSKLMVGGGVNTCPSPSIGPK